ncbi:MAG: carbohydrate binding domain-containing protein [Bacteroidales bacterium]|nr:carbohydrate binding domain-containing protein [Bacteroidales bacterium]
MIIYNKLGVQIADVDVSDDSYRHKAIVGENILTLYFSLPEYAEIPVGSYCDFKGERYTLTLPENLKRQGKRNLEYTLVLESDQHLLARHKVRNPTDKRLKFPLTAKPIEHLQLIVDILNTMDGGWSIGTCIDGVEKEIAYSHTFLSDALRLQADTFETEYEIVGKSISLKKVEYNKEAPLALSYGYGNGFEPGCGRSNYENTVPVEVLFVEGGDKNIDFSKYGSKQLRLPKSKSLVYEGRTYVTDPDGLFIKRGDKALFTGQEDSLDCSHIFPSRVGTVTSVDVVNEGSNLYDILDNTIPAALDYSLCRIAGEKATIRFESGMLAGKEFDLVQSESAFSGYIHTDRRFKIVPQEIDGQIMPNGTFAPAVGDKYAIFGIQLPDAYFQDDATKTGASWDMFREGAKYLFEHEDPRFSFSGQLNGIWSKANWLAVGGKIKLGGYVAFTDLEFQTISALVRIIDINEYVNSPYEPKIELSNVAVGGGTLSSELKKLASEEVIVDSKFRESLQFTKRRFRDAQETMTLLSQSLLNFSGSVSPITVQTMALLVGDESLQFRFVNSKVAPVKANHVITFDNATKVLSAAAGILQHMTIGVKTISQSHAAAEYKFWDMSAYNSPPLTEANASKAYYLYAKCANPGTAGVFVLSDVAIGMTSVAGYYHFLVGILNSENSSERSYVSLYGFSEVLPGRITTDKIVSPDGRLVIDLSSNPPKIRALDGAIIEGKVQFQAGSSGLAQLAEWPTAAQDIQDATAAAAEADRKAVEAQEKLANDIDPKLAKMQEQIDGEVSGYYLPYSPTLANYPASEWLTTAQKEAHLGDTFNNNLQFISDIETPDAGKSWRWTKSGTDYFWNRISDSDAVLALKRAAEAKGVADGKSTHYLIQPSAYKFGDSWVCDIVGDAEKGSMLFATQDSNVFNRAHWVKKDKYTDDTAVNNLKVGGRNLLLNSDFKNGIGDWVPYQGTTLSQSASGSLLIDFSTASNVPYNGIKSRYIISLDEVGDYTVSLYIKRTAEHIKVGVQIESQYLEILPSVPVNTWGKLTHTFKNLSSGYMYIYSNAVSQSGVLEIEWIQLEKGNIATDHSPAFEDIFADATAKSAAAQAAAETYALAKASLAEVTAKAYADGIVTEEETRAIADATAKANAAQAAAISAAADDATSKVSAIQVGSTNLLRNSGDFKDLAYWEVIRGAAAITTALATETLGGKKIIQLTVDSGQLNAVIEQPILGILPLTTYSLSLWYWPYPHSSGKFYITIYEYDVNGAYLGSPQTVFTGLDKNAEGGAKWEFGQATFTTKATCRKIYFSLIKYPGTSLFVTNISCVAGNKPMVDWKLAQEDVAADATAKAAAAQTAAQEYALAKASLAEVTAKAYADGIVTDEEVRAIADATAKANAAQAAAISAAAADASSKSVAAQSAAEAYALSKANLAEVTAKAYADGVVTDEETRAIADATAKANAAQAAAISAAAADATAKAAAIKIGAKNLITNSNFKYGINDWQSLQGTTLSQSASGSLLIDFSTASNALYNGIRSKNIISLDEVGDYTVSLYIKRTAEHIKVGVQIENQYLEILPSVPVNTWGKLTHTFKNLSSGYMYIYSNAVSQSGVLEIEWVQLEKGNKDTDHRPSFEDIQTEIDAAKALALELDYLKTALAGTTEVAGGLILARMMMLKNALNQVTAGISGMDSNDIFLFANDTDALNAALNNMATFLLRRNGTGNLGTLKFTRNGLAYCTRNADGTLGKAIIEFRNTPIPQLSDLVASFTDTKAAPGGNATKMGGVLTGNFGYGVPIIVSAYDNFSMRITGTLEASINNVGDMPILDSHAAINLVLYKYEGGVYSVEQNVASLYLLRDVTGSDSDTIAVDETYTLPKGTYYLRAEYYINTSEGSHDSGFVSASNLQMVASGASGNQTMIFGSNGFVRVKDGNNFTYMSDEYMAHRGPSDMPGVRGSGSVSSGGSFLNGFGKATNSVKNSTGLYTISHSMGHANYSVNLSLVTSNAQLNAVVTLKDDTSFDVRIVNASSNTLADSAFDFSIYANS